MEIITLFLIIAFIIALFLGLFGNKNNIFFSEFNCLEKKKVFTKAEKELYKVLYEYVILNDLVLLSKVRLADFIGHKKGYYDKESYKTFNKINRKHVDFLISDFDGNILCLIELDGKSHSYKKTIDSDNMKNELFEVVGLPLIRYQNYGKFDMGLIDSVIFKVEENNNAVLDNMS